MINKIFIICLVTIGIVYSYYSYSLSVESNVNVEKSASDIIPNTPSPTSNLIDCPMDVNCGGGTKKLSVNDCKVIFCCKVGQNWSIYYSKALCTTDQNNFDNSKSALTNKNNNSALIKCANSTGDYQYDFGLLTYDECIKKSNLFGGNAQIKVDCSSSEGEYRYDFGKLTSEDCKIKINEYFKNYKSKCSYSNGEYQFDYGDLTLDECKIKSEEYFANKKLELDNYVQPTAIINSDIPTNTIINRTNKTKYTNCINQCTLYYEEGINSCKDGFGVVASACTERVIQTGTTRNSCNDRCGNLYLK
jgi:hypothetical protein